MRSDMWRLYRHILIGGLLISLVCFSLIAWLKQSYQERELLQQLAVDVELTAALYKENGTLTDISNVSVFKWEPLGPISSESRTELLHDSDLVLANVYSGTQLALKGESHAVQFSLLQPMLQRFLEVYPLQWSKKLDLLNTLKSISIKKIEPSPWLTSEVSLHQAVDRQLYFLWQPSGSDQAWRIQFNQANTFSFGTIVFAFILLSLAALLVLVWIGFMGLDRKRVHFETITRQIARGRGALPHGVVDSSGTLKELAYSFDSMSTHIQRLLKVQREMINAISHELRTPIARLRFGLEVLKDDVSEELESSITALEYDVEELNTLVDEVLTYGKLEEGTLALNFERASIRQILDSIVEHNNALLQNYKVHIEIQGDEWVNADAHHLHRALQNLILNASKYANSTIAITFTADDERWQVDIEDDGRGIPEEDRDKVFIPFQRLDNSRTRASGGYGLGLAIVQRIAFWHGGAVLVEGSELGGAKFSFIWSKSQHQNSLG
ncbi:ATP-binding protein [Marinomonas ostreistagni]|uniref:histidine kinase n=1 Tax=Marinomonas ostreistagni TaxID=359209 RepID=A0ABS0Z7Z0_9GAMM|nr:ATP-binding protein [Marinomonas ostreistagni]MBJ7549293.1 ATP-binding protein [Marinomonas ostreistagni]